MHEGVTAVSGPADRVYLGALRLNRLAGELWIGVIIDLDRTLALIGILQELHICDLATLNDGFDLDVAPLRVGNAAGIGAVFIA